MQRTADNHDAGQGPSFRRAIAALLLALFVLGNFAVQTHVHGAPSAAHLTVALSLPAPANLPDDDQHCPLCQAFVSGGSFLLASAPLLILPQSIGRAQVPPVAESFARAFAHGWQSRAPPVR